MMPVHQWLRSLFSILFLSMVCLSVSAAPPPGRGSNGNGKGGKNSGFTTIKSKDWDETAVRRVLMAFAYGGHATDSQILAWAGMKPQEAIAEILTFQPNNDKLSPVVDENALHCGSLEELMEFWSSDDPGNMMKYTDRQRYATVNANMDLFWRGLQYSWTKAINTRGCNPFPHKFALFLTNYHAALHIRNTDSGMMRAYYDDYLAALASGADFVEVMRIGATHATTALAYRHRNNRFNTTGTFYGNDDFAREFFQLFFRINGALKPDGTPEDDPDYHEDITIEHNAWLLSGMQVEKMTGAYGADNSGDWWISPLTFADYTDDTGRNIWNQRDHYPGNNSPPQDSCLELLHTSICGSTAEEKLMQLAPAAGVHPESMANVPVELIEWFADDNLDEDEIAQIRGAWVEHNFDLLAFMRDYATSTAFHSESTYKYKTAFERNLTIQNGNVLTNEETFGRDLNDSPLLRMRDQGVLVFEPIRAVFGHQTGIDAVNNPYIFKESYSDNTESASFLYDTSDTYTLENGGPELVWNKNWGEAIPVDANGDHVVHDVAFWLWNHFIGDGGKNYDDIARANIESLLATGRDLWYEVDNSAVGEGDPIMMFSTAAIGQEPVLSISAAHAATVMDLGSSTGNYRVGLAVNFITMMPYAFAMEGR